MNDDDIFWILEGTVRVWKLRSSGGYRAVEIDGKHRTCDMVFTEEGRLTFNGEDIETEDFLGFVGMTDIVNDSPNKDVTFSGEADMTFN